VLQSFFLFLFSQKQHTDCIFSQKNDQVLMVSPKFGVFVNLTWNFDFMMNHLYFLYRYIFDEFLLTQYFKPLLTYFKKN